MRKAVIWLTCLAALVGLIAYLNCDGDASDVSYTEFVAASERGDFGKIVVDPVARTLTGQPKEGAALTTHYAGDEDIAERFRSKGLEVEVRASESFNPMPIFLLVMLALLVFVLWRVMRGLGGGGAGQALSFAKSKVRREDPKDLNVRFDDVKGIDEAKREVMEYLDYAKDSVRYMRVGAKMPKGILLVGETGTGKTMLARALACEAGVPFFSISGSDFVEMFVGVGAARVRDTMAVVRQNAPSILFIDEIDAVGRSRGAGMGYNNDEREQTLNQILVELDGIATSHGVLVIAATNRPDVLDPALLRPGRFDRKVFLPVPDVVGRQAILEAKVRGKPLFTDVDLAQLAMATFRWSGADLENLVNEAAVSAARRNAATITMADFEVAREKIALGSERRLKMVEDEKRRVAVHEAGHAVVATLNLGNPVYKVTVIPRDKALGLTYTLPEEERYLTTEEGLEGLIQMLFGGRLAEKLLYGNLSTGASDDLKRATAIARDMVKRFGMSEKVGPVVFMEEQGPMFLGQSFSDVSSHAEETLREIDREIKRILTESESKAEAMLTAHKAAIEALADALMVHETVDGDTVRAIVKAHAP